MFTEIGIYEHEQIDSMELILLLLDSFDCFLTHWPTTNLLWTAKKTVSGFLTKLG